MAADEVILYNLALDKIGARANISLPSEQSREAEACNRWFPNIRDQVLASASWPDATKMERLALLATQDGDTWVQGKPRPDLLNAFALPSDYLRAQNLTDFSSFVIQSYNDDNRALMTNTSLPIMVYTFRNSVISLWGPELQMAIMLGLAANICVPLTGKTSRAKLLLQEANQLIISARESAANTNNEMSESIPDWIAARGYAGAVPRTRFFYPSGALLSANVG